MEILKQLYLERRFVVLDEPTSVLTPAEADEVLGDAQGHDPRRRVTVLMITHKFREVMASPTPSACCAAAASSARGRRRPHAGRRWPR